MVSVPKIPNWNSKNPLFRKAEHIPAVEKPVSVSAKAAVRYTDPRIDMQIFKRKENGSLYAVIKFYSHVKPNWLLQGDVEFENKSERELNFFVAVTCGVMAEQLDEKYGDNFDPEKSARQGERTFGELLREWEKQAAEKG